MSSTYSTRKKTEEGWLPINEEPPHDTKIDWLDGNGHVVYGGKKSGRLWFLPDGMYVNYEPKFWRISRQETSK